MTFQCGGYFQRKKHFFDIFVHIIKYIEHNRDKELCKKIKNFTIPNNFIFKYINTKDEL